MNNKLSFTVSISGFEDKFVVMNMAELRSFFHGIFITLTMIRAVVGFEFLKVGLVVSTVWSQYPV